MIDLEKPADSYGIDSGLFYGKDGVTVFSDEDGSIVTPAAGMAIAGGRFYGKDGVTVLYKEDYCGGGGGSGPGTPGADGESAYEIAVRNGFSGTESQWLASLQGKDGATGATGAQGPAGNAPQLIAEANKSSAIIASQASNNLHVWEWAI